MNDAPAYGLWFLVAINSLVFIIFAFSFTKPKTSRDWRTFGAFSAFIVALFTEMYGFPLTIYMLSGWLQSRYPGVNWFAHDSGHLLEMFFGWRGNPHFGPFHLLSTILIFGGFVLLASAWKVLYAAQQTDTLATSGHYKHIRHPQYAGFVLIMTGFLLQWPTLLILIMFPILVTMYVRLARREEREVLAAFGEIYTAYAGKTPAFFPRLAEKAKDPLEPPPHTRGMPLDWAAPFYDRYCPKIGLGRSFREETLRHAALRPGERVLDVGCGTGVLTRHASRTVGSSGSVTGIDPAPKMIQVARKNGAVEGSLAEFRIATIEDLLFDENSFDCVLSSLMIHHLPPDLKLEGLGETYRVLRPGGRLLVVDIARPAISLWWLFIWPLRFWSFTSDQVTGGLEGYFRKAGFSRIETLGHWKGLLTFYLAYKV